MERALCIFVFVCGTCQRLEGIPELQEKRSTRDNSGRQLGRAGRRAIKCLSLAPKTLLSQTLAKDDREGPKAAPVKDHYLSGNRTLHQRVHGVLVARELGHSKIFAALFRFCFIGCACSVSVKGH